MPLPASTNLPRKEKNVAQWLQHEVLMRVLSRKKGPQEQKKEPWDLEPIAQEILDQVIREFVDFEARIIIQECRVKLVPKSMATNTTVEFAVQTEQVVVDIPQDIVHVPQPEIPVRAPTPRAPTPRSPSPVKVIVVDKSTHVSIQTTSVSSPSTTTESSSEPKPSVKESIKISETSSLLPTTSSLSEGEVLTDMFSDGEIIKQIGPHVARELLEMHQLTGEISRSNPRAERASASGSSGESKNNTTISTSIEISSIGEVNPIHGDMLRNVSMGEIVGQISAILSEGEIEGRSLGELSPGSQSHSRIESHSHSRSQSNSG